jgi:signal transduction histidine kinase
MQVVINLLSNAAKFARADGGRVRVRLRRQNGRLAVSVEDNGPGIPLGQNEVVFDRFHQLEADDLSGKPQGWGLGLAICRQIVEHFGGRIWVEPAQPSGAVFSFTLPTTLAPAGED